MPPHLVGERLRALSVLACGGLVCMSAAAAVEGLPSPESERPPPIEMAVGGEAGLEELTGQLVLAGYERIERVEERGQIAVRGGILDIFGTTGREPIRVEFFGDVVEGIRGFSAFTQRTLYALEQATIFPATERRADLPDAGGDDAHHETLVASADIVWRPTEVRELWRDELGVDPEVRGAELDPPAERPAVRLRGAEAGARRARACRGRARAERAHPLGSPSRRVVSASR